MQELKQNAVKGKRERNVFLCEGRMLFFKFVQARWDQVAGVAFSSHARGKIN